MPFVHRQGGSVEVGAQRETILKALAAVRAGVRIPSVERKKMMQQWEQEVDDLEDAIVRYLTEDLMPRKFGVKVPRLSSMDAVIDWVGKSKPSFPKMTP